LPEYRLPTGKRWEYAAAARLGQRSIIFTRGKRNILGQQLYSFWKRQSKGDQLANFKQGNGDYGGIGQMMEGYYQCS
jgi:formylglycine-generating enzyme required for sulfatase activity